MTDFRKHLTDAEVEQFCSGEVPAAEVERVEEHLLFCHQCLDLVELSGAVDEVIRVALGVTPTKKPREPRVMHAGGAV